MPRKPLPQPLQELLGRNGLRLTTPRKRRLEETELTRIHEPECKR